MLHTAYHEYVHGELARAADTMACCATTHHISTMHPDQLIAVTWMLTVVLLGVYVTYNVVSRKRHLAARARMYGRYRDADTLGPGMRF